MDGIMRDYRADLLDIPRLPRYKKPDLPRYTQIGRIAYNGISPSPLSFPTNGNLL